MKHYLRNNSVSVYGLVLDIEYYYTPPTEATQDHPGDDCEVEINRIFWTNSAGETQNVTDLLMGLSQVEDGKILYLTTNHSLLRNLWTSLWDGIIEAIEKLEQ